MRSLLPSLALLTLSFWGAPETYAQQDTSAGADPVPDIQTLKSWEQCREYLPSKHSLECRIDFDMARTKDVRIPPETHKDITVHLGRDSRGVVVLWHSSPFAACSLTTTPGPLARDLSPNVSASLASIATGGAMPEVSPLPPSSLNAVSPSVPSVEPTAEEAQPIRDRYESRYDAFVRDLRSKKLSPRVFEEKRSQAESEKNRAIEEEKEKLRQRKAQTQKSIKDDEKTISDLIQQFQDQQKQAERLYHALDWDNDPKDLKDIHSNYFYSYSDDGVARDKIKQIKHDAVSFLSRPLPDGKTVSGMQDTLDKIVSRVDGLERAYPNDQGVHDFVGAARLETSKANSMIAELKKPERVEAVSYLTDAIPKVQKLLDFIDDWEALTALRKSPDASVQILPIAVYPESKVGVTVKCADAVNATPLFDNIQFNAYFQSPPIFDISAGALISTLHGRQATTQTPYGNPATTSCPGTPTKTAICPVVVINVTRPQFVPGVFIDWHPVNFKLPGVRDPATKKSNPPDSINTWMSEKAPRHPFGYVGSLGLAAGFLVNPNNGTVQAEFFEGISFGIQRFVFLVGNHTGRSQNLTNGYSVGEQVAPGTTPTTVRNWSNALAFGITYRIPLR